MRQTTAAILLFSSAIVLPACSDGTASAETQSREEIETIVREYILANPEIIEEAILKLNENRQAEEAAAQRVALADKQDALLNDASDYTIGPADAEVTIVEFFDYRCGFCKRSVDYVSSLPAIHDGNVRVVFKEYPILSPQSRQAALAALAAGKQDKYFEMHVALMESNTPLNDEDIDTLAEDVGIDVALMRADMQSTEVQQQLSDHIELAQSIGISGTPNFIIGDEIIPGADTARITALIKEKLSS